MRRFLNKISHIILPFREVFLTLGFIGLFCASLDGFMVSSALSKKMNLAYEFPIEIVILASIAIIFLLIIFYATRKFINA